MASYGYPSNPIVPPNPDQQPYPPAFAVQAPNYGGYPPQPDPSQQTTWSQAAAYGQQQQQNSNCTGYDQSNPIGTNQNNYSLAASDYNTNFPSYGSGGGGGGYNQRGPKGGNNSNYRGNNRNSGQGFDNKESRNNFGASSGMEEQQDTIFVSGLPEETTEEELISHFGSIGLIKTDKKTRKPKIWIYKDKETGKPKGEVTITYDDPPTASSAINWFNGKEFNGCTLKVQLAQRRNNFLAGGGGNRNFGGGRGGGGGGRDFDRRGGGDRNNSGGGGPPRDGDWVCDSCQNNNFAWRDSCNRCKTERPASAGNQGGGDRRNNNLPYDRRGGNQQNGSRDRGSFGGGPRNNNRNDQGGRQFGGPRDGGGRGGRNGGPMRNSDNRRSGPY